MSIFGKLFGGGVSKTNPPDDYTTASWIASVIDGVIATQGFSELEKPHAAIVLDNDHKITMMWSPSIKIGGNVQSFVYLEDLYEFDRLKGSMGLDIPKDLPPKEAKEIIEMMSGTLGQQAVDRLAMAALSELKEKIT